MCNVTLFLPFYENLLVFPQYGCHPTSFWKWIQIPALQSQSLNPKHDLFYSNNIFKKFFTVSSVAPYIIIQYVSLYLSAQFFFFLVFTILYMKFNVNLNRMLFIHAGLWLCSRSTRSSWPLLTLNLHGNINLSQDTRR